MSTFTYDIDTNVGQVRLNIADIDLTTTTGNRDDWTCLFTDEEIEMFLSRADADVNYASYWALLTIAASRSYLAKRKKLGDYEEDLTKMAKDIREMAQMYLEAYQNKAEFDYAEQSHTDFSYRDIVVREYTE